MDCRQTVVSVRHLVFRINLTNGRRGRMSQKRSYVRNRQMGATEIMILRRYGGQSEAAGELKLRILRSFKNHAVRLLASATLASLANQWQPTFFLPAQRRAQPSRDLDPRPGDNPFARRCQLWT